ncbi:MULTISPECIES: dTDP-glucose 4,6-dehydratase [Prochlorococcus]|uniref:dTDP-glucose 4,6-dehydratase n=1 Tax=Prochlorococcus marinus str. MIT 9314 TaxID=167548 RepID=A0A0A2AIJ9_PROMR|nr:dTDP-glucose 4,6-dehydratase [Prochlorococcus marinus]KGG00350.1 dTDP-glucose 4,6-dehydratase [Prochlorococcus marinus str. MIT 9314]
MTKKILITGGAGFIGGALIKRLLKEENNIIYNIDILSYKNGLTRIEEFNASHRHKHYLVNLTNKELLINLFEQINPDAIFHLAAESHVDVSLSNPDQFIQSNVFGTFNLLEATRIHWNKITGSKKENFKFLHISTDEVFGSLGSTGKFNENSNYDPRSPYSASKAASDHFVNAWFHSYCIPTIITNCSNNYGPFQFIDKLIPLAITNGIKNLPIPLYGNGLNIRDWLFVDDHIDALLLIFKKGRIGEKYCIGGFGERTNKEVLEKICNSLDTFFPKEYPHIKLIQNVKDRAGHDKRYAIDPNKLTKELNWKPKISFDKGIELTIHWYLNNRTWWEYLK